MAKAESDLERELYRGIDWKKIRKYGIPVAAVGGAAAIFFTAKSFLNDYRDQGEEVIKNLNSQTAITETTKDMEERGVGITGDPLGKLDKKQPLSSYGSGGDDGWTKIDQDYKPKNIVEKNIKEGFSNDNLLPIYMKNYGNDEELLNKWHGIIFSEKHASHIRSEYKDWMIIDLKYEGEYGTEQRRMLYLKTKKGQWFFAGFGEIR
jgi:hypothetical protein